MEEEVDNEDGLLNVLKTTDRVFVVFYASWCPFCVRFLPIFEDYARKNGCYGFLRARIDDEKNPLWEKYDVKVVPTVILFGGERVLRRLDGALGVGITEDHLKQFFGLLNKKASERLTG